MDRPVASGGRSISGRRKLMLVLLVVICCVGCDRISKEIAADRLAGSAPIGLAGGVVHLGYAENTGAFLGLGASRGPRVRWAVFVLGVGAMLGAVAWHLWRARGLRFAEVVGLSLVLGGGIGNLADRVAHGFVRDFMQIRLGPLQTGVFNAADVAITAGALTVVLYLIREARR